MQPRSIAAARGRPVYASVIERLSMRQERRRWLLRSCALAAEPTGGDLHGATLGESTDNIQL